MPTARPAKGGHDSFRAHALPLLEALLVTSDASREHGGSTKGADGHGDGGGGRLRTDAPRLAFLSDLGHQCTERESGPLLEEDKVRGVLTNLVHRVSHELGLSAQAAATLVGTTCVYHSFTPRKQVRV